MSAPLILVVEDETDIRNLIATTLEMNDFRVVEAVDGQEAIEQATDLMPDAILMDARMPKLTGFEVCQILKQQENTKDIPIIFLSAKGQEADISAGIALGAAAYFVKPFDPADLPQRISEILDEL